MKVLEGFFNVLVYGGYSEYTLQEILVKASSKEEAIEKCKEYCIKENEKLGFSFYNVYSFTKDKVNKTKYI